MSKRLSDTEVWKKSWFFDLPDKFKLFWFYILSDCDAAGIWTANFRITEAFLGKYEPAKLIEAFKDQIIVLDADYWLIKDFIKFQYGYPLKENSPMFKKVDSLLKQRNLSLDTLYDTVSHTVLYTVKDKEEDKDKAEDKDKSVSKELERNFETWYSKYPRKESKQDAIRAWSKNQKEMPDFQIMMQTLANQIRVKNWTKENMKFIPMPATYLNGKRWQDQVEDIPVRAWRGPFGELPQ
jgi:hypothetical protein